MSIERKLIVLDKLKDIEYSLNLIQENLPDELEEFKDSGLIKDGIMKRVEFIIQNMIDVCAILSSDLQLEKPYSEDDIIDNLGKAEVLDISMVRKVKEMKGLRNILVHRYGKINDDLVFESLNQDVEDISRFLNLIRNLLNKI